MAHSGDDFGRAADMMSAGDLARIYPERRVMVPGTEAMSRRGFTSSAAASPHATEEPDRGDAMSPEAAHLMHLNRSPTGAYGEGEIPEAESRDMPSGEDD